MTKELKQRVEAIRNSIHRSIKDLPATDARSVLEEIDCDLEGLIESLVAESGD